MLVLLSEWILDPVLHHLVPGPVVAGVAAGRLDLDSALVPHLLSYRPEGDLPPMVCGLESGGDVGMSKELGTWRRGVFSFLRYVPMSGYGNGIMPF